MLWGHSSSFIGLAVTEENQRDIEYVKYKVVDLQKRNSLNCTIHNQQCWVCNYLNSSLQTRLPKSLRVGDVALFHFSSLFTFDILNVLKGHNLYIFKSECISQHAKNAIWHFEFEMGHSCLMFSDGRLPGPPYKQCCDVTNCGCVLTYRHMNTTKIHVKTTFDAEIQFICFRINLLLH